MITAGFSTLRKADPRYFQIATLGSLLTYGLFVLGFDITIPRALAIIVTAVAAQGIFSWVSGVPRLDIKSALISAFSLCLLLRTSSLLLAVVAAVITIGSKFLIRVDGKHIFNPTNLGIVLMLLLSDQVWVSPGQWGGAALAAFLFAAAGTLVVNRAARSDVTFAFLLFFCAILFGRSLWLGDPMAIPLHRLENGALLLFAFFMISDPKTTPDSRAGRILFAMLVATGAAWIQIKMFRSDALLWSLAGFSILVPLIDRILPGSRYSWSRPTAGNASETSFSHGVRGGRGALHAPGTA